MNFFPPTLPTQVTGAKFLTIVPRPTCRGQWNGDPASWPVVQLQVTTMPRNPLCSANGNADDMHSQLHHLRGTLVVIILTLGLWRWTMEMENGTGRSASGPSCRIYYDW